MDSRAAPMNSHSRSEPSVGLVHVGIVCVLVLAILAGLRLLLGVPKPLLVVAAGVLAACTAVFWVMRRRMTGVALTQMFGLVMAWVSVSALLFGTAFWVDRAGWMWYQLTGYNITLSEDYMDRVGLSSSEFVHHNPMFREADETRVTLRGDVTIDRTVVIPRGVELTIEPGTVLRFGRGCSMIAYGPITARGTEAEPIRFTARHPLFKWGVVGVIGDSSQRASYFEHVVFDHGRQARVNGVDLPGCLSIIGTGVEIRSSRFEKLYGKDAMYVRAGRVSIHGNEFRDTFKDGLDLDGGSGEITRNRFVDCGDEGIDLSRNENLNVYDNVVLDLRGGRVGADQKLEEIRNRNFLGRSDEPGSASASTTGGRR